MGNRPFGWCFIGAGRLAEKVAAQIVPSGRHRIVSVYTRRMERCREFAAKYGALACPAIQEALSAPGVDGVYVVTPHNDHYDSTKTALEAGKAVLCEKPITTDAGQARELFRLAREKNAYLAEAMWTWFAPTANRVKQWVDEGRFGELRQVTANYHANIRGRAGRITDPSRAGGALLDIGIYPITYFYRLFGKPVQVDCRGVLEGGIDLCEDVELTFSDGVRYAASISLKDDRGLEWLRMKGSEASVSIPWFHAANGAALRKGWRTLDRVKGSGGYLNEFDLVAGEIREGLAESRFVPSQATLDVMDILDECRRQMGLVYPFE